MDRTAALKTTTCRRCHGSGEYCGYGKCYGCYGHGVITYAAPTTDSVDPEYAAGLAARATREEARKARTAARR